MPRMGRPHARPEMVWVTTAWKMEAATSSGRAPSLSSGCTSVLAKTPQRLAIPGGNVDLERLMQEVIIPFAAGQPVVYRRYLCREDAFSAPIPLPDAPITILEGSYSMLPDIRRHADLSLFLWINPEVQQERLLQRVGAARLKDFNARWIPLENAYFDAYHLPDESCVLVPQDVNAPVRP